MAAIVWQPELGDPTLPGWTATILYLATLAGCLFYLNRRRQGRFSWRLSSNYHFWKLLSIILFVLGLNKQLDLQSLFLQFNRFAMEAAGLAKYADVFRLWLTWGIVSMLMVITVIFAYTVRDAMGTNKSALCGAVMILVYIVLRAVTFQNIPGMTLLEKISPWTWVIEVTGLVLILNGVRIRISKVNLDAADVQS